MDIIQLTLASTTLAKVLVDLIRQTAKVPSWSYPLLALVFGIISSLLFIGSYGVEFTIPIISQGIISGIMAAGSAVGITELQKRAL